MYLRSVVLLCAMASGLASRVLVVFPLPGKSHSILGHSVVDVLLSEGHEVTYITAFPKKWNNTNLKIIDVSSVTGEVSEKQRLNVVQLASSPRPAHTALYIGHSFTSRGLQHPAVQALMVDPAARFDVVVAEWFFSELLAPMAAVFDCPLVWYYSFTTTWQGLRLVHAPSSAAISADMQSRTLPPQPYSLGDRAWNLWMQIYMSGWQFYVKYTLDLPSYEQLYSPAFVARGRPLPDYDQLAHNASLILINGHPPLGQLVPLPQNAKLIGGHHVSLPVQPLPENLQEILDKASAGAIFFSMGSNLKSKDFPEEMKTQLLEIFGQLEQTVIWKLEDKPDNLPRNVHILDWAPQNSILNHKNTILFITHGGLLSLTEATMFGVPLIGVPLFADQFYNVNLAVESGSALRVDFNDQLPQRLKESINKILQNPSYRDTAKQNSLIFTDRLASPQRELAHWVQLVARTGGALHLRSPALQLSAIQCLHLDILALIALGFWLLSKVLKTYRAHLTPEDIDKKDN